MRIVMAGASGFLGQPLMRRLRAAGHEVTQLVRRPPAGPHQLQWDPARPLTLPDGTETVINLCGVGAGDHRWSDEYKKRILTSRTVPTSTLARAVRRQGIPALVNSSGVTYYGECGDRRVIEADPPGDGFLAGVARTWEAATRPASDAGSRVVLLRTGLPLHRSGGFLKAQLLPFKLGLGAKLGSGRQWVPWISLLDWLAAMEFLLSPGPGAGIDGPVNLVGPEPVTNAEFTRELAAGLHRPALFTVPYPALWTLYGGIAGEGYRSLRALPAVLGAAGFTFTHRTVAEALHFALHDPLP